MCENNRNNVQEWRKKFQLSYQSNGNKQTAQTSLEGEGESGTQKYNKKGEHDEKQRWVTTNVRKVINENYKDDKNYQSVSNITHL